MFAKLSALVGSAPTFPYTLGDPFQTAWGGWKHFQAKANSDGSPVSVFRISSSNKQDPKLSSARNGVKRLRTVCTITCTTHSEASIHVKPDRLGVGAVAAPQRPFFQGHS